MQDANKEETATLAKLLKKARQLARTTQARNKVVQDKVLVKIAKTQGKNAIKKVTLNNSYF